MDGGARVKLGWSSQHSKDTHILNNGCDKVRKLWEIGSVNLTPFFIYVGGIAHGSP